jgi:general secretion pathway protein A
VTSTGAATIYDHLFRSFGLRENPFHVSPDPRFLFSGAAYDIALTEIKFGIESHRGLVVLSGEAGTGKTTLVRHFLQWLQDRQFSSSYIFHTHLDPTELFEFILRDFGVPVDSTKKTDLLAMLHRWLQLRQTAGDSPVVIIDEAQALSMRTLSELSLLLNLENARGKLLQIVLAGQPELEEKLRRPELRAIRQRIMVRCRLPLLTLEETGEYIASRLRGAGAAEPRTFPPETVQMVYSYARGIPRVVNLLCEHALIGAYADRQTVVSPGNVRKVAAEFDLSGEPCASNYFDLPVAKFPVEVMPAREPTRVSDVVAAAIPVEPPVTEIPRESDRAGRSSLAPAIPAPAVDSTPPVHAKQAEPLPPRGLQISGAEVVGNSGWKKHRPESSFHRYWRDVRESFTRDMRSLYRSMAPQLATIAGRIPSSPANLRKSFIEPFFEWLAKPINSRNANSDSVSVQSRRKDRRH